MEEKKENMPAVSYIKMAKSIQPTFVENDRLDWIPAGENDKLFDELIEFSNYDGMHHAILQTRTNLVSGSRIEFKGSEKPNANESWEELCDKLACDLEIVGACDGGYTFFRGWNQNVKYKSYSNSVFAL